MRQGLTRREMAGAVAGALLPEGLPGQTEAREKTVHDMGGLKYTMPPKPEQIGMLIYPGMTALDLVGPQQVFGYMMATVHTFWKTKDAVTTDTGLTLTPSRTFEDCPEPLDLLFVPGGGSGAIALMKDRAVLEYLAAKAKTATWVTSVCSGSLILAAAGLLRGYRATSHWAVRDVLPEFGATAVNARVVEDRNRVTGAGITSGIDFALRLAGKLRGDDYARGLELTLEYDPQPPFGGGSPAKAAARVLQAMSQMYAPLNAAARAVAAEARKAQP